MQSTSTSTGVIAEHDTTIRRTGDTVSVRTFHANPNCAEILARGARIIGPGTAADAFECDYCADGEVEIIVDPAEYAATDGLPREYGTGTGHRGGLPIPSNEPTEKQIRFWTRLLDEKTTPDDLDALVADMTALAKAAGRWTKKGMSDCIDLLLAAPTPGRKTETVAPADVPPTVPGLDVQDRPNRYSGSCVYCRGQVGEGAGYLAKLNGKWAVVHQAGDCVAREVEVVEDEAECPVGMHRTDDGIIFKVQIAVHGSGKPYAKRLVVVRDVVEAGGIKWLPAEVEFVYAQGAVKFLSEATLMSFEEAREFGALYGTCCVCGITLTDELSIALGIGPVCGQHGFANDLTLTEAQLRLLGKIEIAGGRLDVDGRSKKSLAALIDMGLVRVVETAPKHTTVEVVR